VPATQSMYFVAKSVAVSVQALECISFAFACHSMIFSVVEFSFILIHTDFTVVEIDQNATFPVVQFVFNHFRVGAIHQTKVQFLPFPLISTRVFQFGFIFHAPTSQVSESVVGFG